MSPSAGTSKGFLIVKRLDLDRLIRPRGRPRKTEPVRKQF
jgi:hypothetical protein